MVFCEFEKLLQHNSSRHKALLMRAFEMQSVENNSKDDKDCVE